MPEHSSRVGHTDLMWGLIALISNELRATAPDKVLAIRAAWLFQGLVKLSAQPEYADDLRYVEEGSFGTMLFLMQSFHIVEVENGGREFIMRKGLAERRLGVFGRDHGIPALEKLRRMVSELMVLPLAEYV